MNEELQETLAVILQRSIEVAEQTGQWALDKAPQLIEQYLMWEFYSALFVAILGVILLFTSLFIRYYSSKNSWWKKDNYAPSFRTLLDLIFTIGGMIGGPMLILTNIYTMMFIIVAPEIYLIKNLL